MIFYIYLLSPVKNLSLSEHNDHNFRLTFYWCLGNSELTIVTFTNQIVHDNIIVQVH